MSTLNRRNFLGHVSGLFALSLIPSRWAKAEQEQKRLFFQDVKKVTRFTTRCYDGNLRLEVALLVLKEDQIEERRTGTGDDLKSTYYYKGKKLPHDGGPGLFSLITKFDFFWDEQQIEIPRRFWADLPRFDIETMQIDRSKLSSKDRYELQEFEEWIRQPRVSLSDEASTALIEWDRCEDGADNRSTTRWMISRSGTVLRHRYFRPGA